MARKTTASKAVEAVVKTEPAVDVGSIVRYVLPSGEVRPAIVTAVSFATVNMQVFVDGGNDGYSADQVAVWKEGVAYSAGKEPGTWH